MFDIDFLWRLWSYPKCRLLPLRKIQFISVRTTDFVICQPFKENLKKMMIILLLLGYRDYCNQIG